MKSSFKHISRIVLFLFFATGCYQVEPTSSAVTSLPSTSSSLVEQTRVIDVVIEQLPTKSVYEFLEPISLDGGIFKVIYSDNTQRFIPMSQSMLSLKANTMQVAGIQQIFVKLEIDSKSFEKSFNVTVKPFIIPLKNVNIDVNNIEILNTQTYQVYYFLDPVNATLNSIAWVSLNPLIATIDNNGLITPLKLGDAKFNLVIDQEVKATLSVKIIKSTEEVVFGTQPIVNLFATIDFNLDLLDVMVLTGGILSPDHPDLGVDTVRNITIDASVGEGEVFLQNLNVLGDIIVLGGGAQSVYLQNVNIVRLFVNKSGVKIELEDGTIVEQVFVQDDATINLGPNIVVPYLEVETGINNLNINSTDNTSSIVALETSSNLVLNVITQSLAINASANITIQKEVASLEVNAPTILTNESSINNVVVKHNFTVFNPSEGESGTINNLVIPNDVIITPTLGLNQQVDTLSVRASDVIINGSASIGFVEVDVGTFGKVQVNTPSTIVNVTNGTVLVNKPNRNINDPLLEIAAGTISNTGSTFANELEAVNLEELSTVKNILLARLELKYRSLDKLGYEYLDNEVIAYQAITANYLANKESVNQLVSIGDGLASLTTALVDSITSPFVAKPYLKELVSISFDDANDIFDLVNFESKLTYQKLQTNAIINYSQLTAKFIDNLGQVVDDVILSREAIAIDYNNVGIYALRFSVINLGSSGVINPLNLNYTLRIIVAPSTLNEINITSNNISTFNLTTVLIESEIIDGIKFKWNGVDAPSTYNNGKYSLNVSSVKALNGVIVSAPNYLDKELHIGLSFLWKNEINTDWYGDGSETEFYISTASQLSGLAHLVNYQDITFENKTIYLASNLNLLNQEWNPIGNWDGYIGSQQGDKPFKGTFDGLGYIIYNLNISSRLDRVDPLNEKSATGLFGAVNGTLRNIKLQNVNITGPSYVGALVGNLNGVGENISLNSAVINGSHFVGSVVGMLQSAVLTDIKVSSTSVNATYLNTQDSGDKVGGIAGYFRYASILDVVMNNVAINAERDVGGVVGAAADEDSIETHNLIQNVTLSNIQVNAILPDGVSRTPTGYAGLIVGRSAGTARINYYQLFGNSSVNSYTLDNAVGVVDKIVGGGAKSFVLKNAYNTSNSTYYISIQAAIDAAIATDTIKIGSGKFFEEVMFANRNNLTLVGVTNGSSIIAPIRLYVLGNNGITIDNSQNITIRYVTIDGYANSNLGSVPTFRDGVHYLTDSANHNNTFEYLSVKNIDRRGISIFPMTTTNTTIRNSTFDNITGAVMGTWNGSIGINFQGTGLVENNEVSNMHTGLIHNSNIANGIVTIRNNHFHTFKDSSAHQLGFFNAGINVWPRSSETMIIENNIITSPYTTQVGMYLNALSKTSVVSNNILTLTGESVVGLDILNNKDGGFEIKNNIISVGAYSSGIALSTVGTLDYPMQIDNNILVTLEPKTALSIDYEYNDFFFYKTTSRSVGILLSGSNSTKRVKDTVGLRATYADVTNNQITDFTQGIYLYSDAGFSSWESLVVISGNQIVLPS